MNKDMENGYNLTTKTRWVVVGLSTVLAYFMFGLQASLFNLVATILAHELPTLVMGIYIYIKMRKDKDGDKFNRMD